MQECKDRDPRPLEWKDGESERERFEKWWYAQGYSGICRHDMDMSFKAWNARQPEIDTLNTQVNKLTDDAFFNTLERTKLQAGIVALKAENEKLRKDAERLDALSLPGMELVIDHEPEPKDDAPFVVMRVSGSRNDREWTEIGRGETVRAAIDAAVTAPDTKGEPE